MINILLIVDEYLRENGVHNIWVNENSKYIIRLYKDKSSNAIYNYLPNKVSDYIKITIWLTYHERNAVLEIFYTKEYKSKAINDAYLVDINDPNFFEQVISIVRQ